MALLPIIVPPEEGEYLYGYLIRLALINRFQNFKDFTDLYIFPGKKEEVKNGKITKCNKTLSLGLNDYLINILDVLYIPSIERSKFISDTTIYPALAKWMSEGQKAHMVNNFAIPEELYPNLLVPQKTKVLNLKVCPECMKEEQSEKGFWYFHREHQIPGVCYCQKHQSPLMYFTKKQLIYFDLTKPQNLEITDNAFLYDYAVLAEKLLHFSASKENIVNQMRRMIKDIPFNELLSIQNEYPYPSTEKALRALLIGTNSLLNFEKMTSLLTCLVDRYGFSFEPHEVNLPEIFGFRMMSGDSDISVYEHEKCGTRFLTTPYALSVGWGCPKCNKTTEGRKFTTIVERMSNHTLKLITPFEGMQKKVSFRCSICGNTFSTLPKDFLEASTHCSCHNSVEALTENNVRKMTNKAGFTLMKYTSSKDLITLKCRKCGGIFRIGIRAFRKNPHCRLCEKKLVRRQLSGSSVFKVKTNDEIAQQIRDLTGNDFEIIKVNNRDDITLKCMKCGNVFKTNVEKFVYRGVRCKCYKYPYGKDFCNFVTYVTYGEYKCSRLKESKYKLTNIDGTIIILTKQQIVAELSRPGPSSKLPVKRKMPYVTWENFPLCWAIELFMKAEFELNTVFLANDVIIKGYTGDEILNCLNTVMVLKGTVEREGEKYIYKGSDFNG